MSQRVLRRRCLLRKRVRRRVRGLTEADDGTCRPIPNGADPESECPGASSCNGSAACWSQSLDSMGYIVVTGSTSGAFPGSTSSGLTDIFVAKLDPSGVLQ